MNAARTHLTAGHIPPKARPTTCRICTQPSRLVRIRRWPGTRLWIGETICCHNSQTIPRDEERES